jgi:hypothetical protein
MLSLILKVETCKAPTDVTFHKFAAMDQLLATMHTGYKALEILISKRDRNNK